MAINLDHVTEQIQVTDAAANASLTVQPKGTGAFNIAAGSSGVNISNGGTVTAITRINAGGGYTSFPSIAISAPTTASGVQATATVTQLGVTAAAVTSGGTGYTNGDVLTIVGGTPAAVTPKLTVTGVSGGVITSVSVDFLTYTAIPTSPVSVTGGTGSGATFTLTYFVPSGIFTITNAGSGYVEQPTVTFSGGGGSGAAAYATVGSGTVVKSIGSTLDFYTPASGPTSIPAFRVVDAGGTASNYVAAYGGVSGAYPALFATGSDTNINFAQYTKGTGSFLFNTASGASNQFRVAHTASAVNFVQVTGAATGNDPLISGEGSDANRNIRLASKGAGAVIFATNTSTVQFRVLHTGSAVNYGTVTGAAVGTAPKFSVEGSDTNIPLVLQPKGTGALQAQQTDSTATGGNARGANAVDWQTNRDAASKVASGQYSIVAGGNSNTASGISSVVGGGGGNSATTTYAAILSGLTNTSSNLVAVVAGGQSNIASGYLSFVGGGILNTAGGGEKATVVGGALNTGAGFYNFIGGGYTNTGTTVSAVTTQSATMNGTTAVTLSGSNASIKVGQYISGTSIAGDTYVAAISGTSLTLSKVASGSSTSTLSFYTPHGVVVGGGNNQATGSYSFIGGGGDAGTAANRNVASGDWSVVVGGIQNVASGLGSVIAGGGYVGAVLGNTASGTAAAVLGGISNNASALYATILGGRTHTGNGNYSTIVGAGWGSTRGLTGYTVFPASSAPIAGTAGVSQAAMLVLGKQTTDATATVITSDGSAASTTNQVILPNNSAYYFRGTVVAGVTGGGNSKSWTIEGLIKRGANAASTTVVGVTVMSPFADVGAATWTIAATADTTNGGLAVTFTGQAGTTIRTVAKIETTEMTY